MSAHLQIVQTGWSTSIQDMGRPGWAHLGVSPSGAVDATLAATANRLVGNPDGAAVVETAGGLVVRAVGALVVAVTTEPLPRSLADGALLRVDPDPTRRWHYVAVRGGLAVEPVLGSRSTDTIAGIGPPIPVPGALLPVGPDPRGPLVGEPVPAAPPADVVRIEPGPRFDWITDSAMVALTTHEWRIGSASRVGVRLTGPALERAVEDELPSEGLVRGAVQVPPDGQPVVMLADHPTTGGYPVVAVVHPDDVAAVGQRPDGTTIRLRR